jgi:hypothetical protein
MSLLKGLLKNARTADLNSGIHDNCILLNVSNAEKKNKEGVVQKRNNYTTFGKVDDTGKVTAQKEISWFNIDSSTDYAYDNFFNQLDQMVGLLDCFVSKEDTDKAINSIFEEEEIESKEDLEEAIKDKKTTKSIMSALGGYYVEALSEHLKGDKIRVKLCYDKNGRYIQQPKFEPFTESMLVGAADSRIRMSKTELAYEQKAQSTSVTTTSAPSL